jgi:hypothetical protein
MAYDDEEVGRLVEAFSGVVGPNPRPFGSRSMGTSGVSDGAEGVQWNAWFDVRGQQAYVGVNLEGKEYDGWPVARLIERELRRPELPQVIAALHDTASVELHWWRDCWQVAARPRILEAEIPPTPIHLDRLTPEAWRTALNEAQGCLDPLRGFRGRGRQMVTLAASGRREEKAVSPHLHFRRRLWRSAPFSLIQRTSVMGQAKTALEPLYEFVAERSVR